jgi:hypothetical protein
MRAAIVLLAMACTRPPDAVAVDPSTPLVGLTPAQTAAVCAELAHAYPPKQATCGDAIVTVGETATACGVGLGDLVPTCSATVADEQACLAQTYVAPCDSQSGLEACDEVLDCQGSDD